MPASSRPEEVSMESRRGAVSKLLMETVTRVKPAEQQSSNPSGSSSQEELEADLALQQSDQSSDQAAGIRSSDSNNTTSLSPSSSSPAFEESPDDGAAPPAPVSEPPQPAEATDGRRRSSPSTRTTAAAAAVGGVAGLVGPAAAMGPLAMAGGPVLGLGVAGALAYGAACRPEGDTFGEFSRQLGNKGLEAAAQAKQLGKTLHQRGSEVTVCVQERLSTVDQDHQISAKVKQAGRKACEDVQSLGEKSVGEVRGLWSALWGGPMVAAVPAQQQRRADPPAASTAA